MTQWVKDLALPSCGISHSCSLDLMAGTGTSICLGVAPKKKKKKHLEYTWLKVITMYVLVKKRKIPKMADRKDELVC